MTIKSFPDFDVIDLKPSDRSKNKYRALIKMKNTGLLKYVWFGHVEHLHYRDSTDLKLYSHLNHLNDKKKKLT